MKYSRKVFSTYMLNACDEYSIVVLESQAHIKISIPENFPFEFEQLLLQFEHQAGPYPQN